MRPRNDVGKRLCSLLIRTGTTGVMRHSLDGSSNTDTFKSAHKRRTPPLFPRQPVEGGIAHRDKDGRVSAVGFSAKLQFTAQKVCATLDVIVTFIRVLPDLPVEIGGARCGNKLENVRHVGSRLSEVTDAVS